LNEWRRIGPSLREQGPELGVREAERVLLDGLKLATALGRGEQDTEGLGCEERSHAESEVVRDAGGEGDLGVEAFGA
jgi:hypothetical protein